MTRVHAIGRASARSLPVALAAFLLACSADPATREGAVAEVGTALPSGAQPARIQILTGFDDEGVVTAPFAPASLPGPYFAGGTLYAGAAELARWLAPSVEVRVVNGAVRIGGAAAAWPARLHGGVLYLPVDSLAVRLGAWPRLDPPSPAATLWPARLLCEFAGRVHPAHSPVLLDAAEAGLLARCVPPLEFGVARLEDAPDDAPWAASLQFSTVVSDSALHALLVAYDAWPYRVEMLAGTMEVVYSAADPAAASASLVEVAAESRRATASAEEAVAQMLAGARAEAVGWLQQVIAATPRAASPPVGGATMPGGAALAGALARVQAGAPIVHSVHVIAPAARLRALVGAAAADSPAAQAGARLVARAGVHVGDRWSVPPTYAPR